jgi:hypothetical protein
MKKTRVLYSLLGAFLLVFTGGPLPLFDLDMTTSSYAMARRPVHSPFGNGTGGTTYNLPDPSTLSLMGTGIGGVFLLYALKKRNRK